MKLIIKNSKISGKGSFAPRDIQKGEFIIALKGEIVSRDEINRRIKAGQEDWDDPLQINDNQFVDLDRESLLINHSCNPNAGVYKTNKLYAIKDIERGEEITYDYSTTVGESDAIEGQRWSMKCNCGAKNCRKIIRNYLSIPKGILRKYYSLGAFPDYIKVKVANLVK